MPNYQVIVDEQRLRAFIDWLPPTAPHETFYVALLARNKYAKEAGIGTFNSDRYQCKRFLSTADRLHEKIKQLEWFMRLVLGTSLAALIKAFWFTGGSH